MEIRKHTNSTIPISPTIHCATTQTPTLSTMQLACLTFILCLTSYVFGQCGSFTTPATSPCGMSPGSVSIFEKDSNGQCCDRTPLQGYCLRNVVQCQDGSLYTPRFSKTDLGSAYIGELELVNSVSGQTDYRVCYSRGGARTDGCACLCAIALEYSGLGVNCECKFIG